MTKRPDVLDHTADPQDREAILELLAGVEAGFDRKDAALLGRGFAADAMVVVPDGTVLRGWDELNAHHLRRLGGPAREWRMVLTTLDLRFLGADAAVVLFRQEMTTPERLFANHGTATVVRRDGRWWIAALQNTNVVVRD
ncbi:YybH family protein [Kitasatospora sp. NPDC050543]|uniref:YybH family protein n=1 Tax=Kitasatospora sp. NPDC050543 TaxID=3364054 RepID=UPI00379196A5